MKHVTGMLKFLCIIMLMLDLLGVDTYFQPERELISNVRSNFRFAFACYYSGYKLPEGSVEYLKGLKIQSSNEAAEKSEPRLLCA